MAASRTIDNVKVEIVASDRVAGGLLTNFTSLQIRNDITAPSEASFEVGDDGTWRSMGDVFAPGTQFRVLINDRPRMVGRVEMNDIPLDPQAGATVRFTVRTKLSDAMYASADQRTRVKGVSIDEFIRDLYAPLGYTDSDFIFDQEVSRNLITGKATTRGKAPSDLEPIKLDEARVRPPETIYGAADRHLRRHGFMHWDNPDGKIVVGVPDDEQDPIYTFNGWRGFGGGGDPTTNNILSLSRSNDWSGLPGVVGVFGRAGKRDFTKAKIGAVASDQDVISAGFYRPVLIVAEGIRTQDLAQRAAERELSARAKRKDAFSIMVDGFSFWNGHEQINYAPDTTAMINTDVAGGNAGAYYVHSTTFMRDASSGDTTQIEMVKRGIWRL